MYFLLFNSLDLDNTADIQIHSCILLLLNYITIGGETFELAFEQCARALFGYIIFNDIQYD